MHKIGYLIPEFPGQTHIFFWREMRALNEQGVELDVISTRLPPKGIISHEWAREAMGRTRYLSPLSFGSLVGSMVEMLRAGPLGWARCLSAVRQSESRRLRLLAMSVMGAQLAWLARQRGWRHVHVHSCADSANIAMLANRLSGITYSMTLHGPLKDYGTNQRQKWHFAAFVIVITRKLLGEAKAALDGSLPATVHVAPMGVDLRQLQRRAPYAAWDATQNGACRVFCCARLNPAKGHDDLIRAIALVRDRGLNVRLTIAGEDDAGGTGYRRTIEALIASLNLGDRVTLLGAVAEQRVREELEQAHLFALASRAEPLGVAIMEAMAMEVPTIATNAGGVPELVNSGSDGWLVEPRNPEQLADAIVRLARDGDLCRRLSVEGRRKVMESFDSSVSARVIADEARRLA